VINLARIEFANGSAIEGLEVSKNIRGKRSSRIGFYCFGCGVVHESIPHTELVIIDNDIWMCRKSCEECLKEIKNERTS
jgi:hypothetical protein